MIFSNDCDPTAVFLIPDDKLAIVVPAPKLSALSSEIRFDKEVILAELV